MENQKIKNPVAWFEIYVEDLMRAKKFYQEVLQVEIKALPAPEGMDIEMEAFPMEMGGEGAAGALVKMVGHNPSSGGTIVYFESLDCAIEEARIEGAGGKVIKPKQGIEEFGFMTIATDSEGNTFGLHSMK
jgi:predicted enzyme related to lactoylglutathione lyase